MVNTKSQWSCLDIKTSIMEANLSGITRILNMIIKIRACACGSVQAETNATSSSL